MPPTLPPQAILVPVDFSAHSAAALVFAAELCAAIKAPLIVLHVVHDPGEAPGYYPQRDTERLSKLDDIAAEMMRDFLQQMAQAHPELKALETAVSTLVTGLPVTRILEIIEKAQPRLVVMGSKGRTGLSHLLLGSKSEQIVRLSPVAVTIVKIPKAPAGDAEETRPEPEKACDN